MGIDYTINESKYIFSTLEAILNDKKPISSLNRVNWNTIFRLANIHKIANILYYAILGSDEKMSEDVRKGFYTSFNEALLSYDRTMKAERALFWQLESGGFDTVIFRGANFNELYPFKEMGTSDSLELYILNKDRQDMDALMSKMDFFPSTIQRDDYVLYNRTPKCEIKVFFKNPFYEARMKNHYDGLFKNLVSIENYNIIKGFDTDNYYVFLVSMIANSYALRTVKIRQFLDLWIFYQHYYDDFNWNYIMDTFTKIGINDMAYHILELCFIWFDGATAGGTDELDLYDTMENYILSKGDIGFNESCNYFPLVKELNKLILQEREKLEKEKYKQFLYPDQEYMLTLYPNLAKNKLGLFLAYVIRRIRLLFTNGKSKEVDLSVLNMQEEQEFYEPQNEYPNEEENVMEIKTAPLVVSDDVEVMPDVLPVNINSSNIKDIDKEKHNNTGYSTEEELMQKMENKKFATSKSDNISSKSQSSGKNIKNKNKTKSKIKTKNKVKDKSKNINKDKSEIKNKNIKTNEKNEKSDDVKSSSN